MKKLVSVILSLSLAFSLAVPGLAANEKAPDDPEAAARPAILYKGQGLRGPAEQPTESGGKDLVPRDYIYFGQDDDGPLQWRVLDPVKSSTGAAGSIFLLSEHLIQNSTTGFAYWGNTSGADPVAWPRSWAQNWCRDFMASDSHFSAVERSAVPAVEKPDAEAYLFGRPWRDRSPLYGEDKIVNGAQVRADQMFPLSVQELNDYVTTSQKSEQLKAVYQDGTTEGWWLRSMILGCYRKPGLVEDGFVNYDFADKKKAMRPALHLSQDKILFLSAVDQGAKAAETGYPAPVGSYYGSSWRATFLDDSRPFSVTETSLSAQDNMVQFAYTGAVAGPEEYISLLVLDQQDRAVFYGRLAPVGQQTSGQVSFDLSALGGAAALQGKKILLFNETYHGGAQDDMHVSDYASRPVEVTITGSELPGHPVVYQLSEGLQGQGVGTAFPGHAYRGKLSAAPGYRLPAAVQIFCGDTALTDFSYNSATGEFVVPAQAVQGGLTISASAEQKTPHTITILMEGRPGSTAQPSKQTAVEGETIALSYFPWPGVALQAWKTETPGVSISYGSFVMPDQDVVITAVSHEYFKNTDDEISGIWVKQPPAKVTYQEGESFDPAGMVVRARKHYNQKLNDAENSKEWTVPLAEISHDGQVLQKGQKEVNISYTLDGITVTDKVDVTVTEAEKPAGAIAHKGNSLSLDGEIHINHYVTITGFEGVDIEKQGGLLIWKTPVTDEAATFETAETVKPGLTKSEYGYGQQTDGIAASEYADTLYFRVYVKDNAGVCHYGPLSKYGVRSYAENMIRKNRPAKQLCIEMLHYGAAAQLYFNYNTGDLANKNIAAQYPAAQWDPAALTPLASAVTDIVPTGDVKLHGHSLSLEGAISMNHYYYNPAFAVQKAELLVWSRVPGPLTEATAARVPMIFDGKDYAAASVEVPSSNYGETVFVCARFEDTDGSVHYSAVSGYSPERYAASKIKQNKNPLLVETVKKMVMYGEEARRYFAK